MFVVPVSRRFAFHDNCIDCTVTGIGNTKQDATVLLASIVILPSGRSFFRPSFEKINALSGFGFITCSEIFTLFERDVFFNRMIEGADRIEIGLPVSFNCEGMYFQFAFGLLYSSAKVMTATVGSSMASRDQDNQIA